MVATISTPKPISLDLLRKVSMGFINGLIILFYKTKKLHAITTWSF